MQTKLNIIAKNDGNIYDILKIHPTGNEGTELIILTHNLFKDNILHKANDLLLTSLAEIPFAKLTPDNLKENIEEYFVRLNWQLYSLFSSDDLKERGISVIYIFIIQNRIFIIQFGRLLCAVQKGKHRRIIGKAWENFRVKTKRDLFLLGSIDEDIAAKIIEVDLKKNAQFFALPSSEADRFDQKTKTANLTEHLESLSESLPFPFIVIARQAIPRSGVIKKLFNKNSKRKKTEK